MTTYNEAREEIYRVFEADWGTTSAFTFDNEEFTPPAGLEWVRVSVRHFEGIQQSLGGVGNRKFQRFGSVFIQIFVPLDIGTKKADDLARTALGIYEGKSLLSSQIRFNGVSMREIGPDDDGYMVVVEAPFDYHETK